MYSAFLDRACHGPEAAKYPNLTVRQLAALTFFYRRGGAYHTRHLAKALGVSKPVVTRLSNALAADGLLEKRRGEADKRDAILRLTSKGLDFMNAFIQDGVTREEGVS